MLTSPGGYPSQYYNGGAPQYGPGYGSGGYQPPSTPQEYSNQLPPGTSRSAPPPQPGQQSASTTPSQTISPEYLSQLFPGGVPQTNTALDPNQEISAVMQNLLPIFKQQQAGLQDSLANAGIVGGSTAGAMGNLGQSQVNTATADTVPLMQAAQQMQLQQALSNTANKFGAGQFDASTFNQMLSEMLGFKNTDWLAQLQAEAGMQEAGAGAQAGAFQPVFTQPSSPSFFPIGGAFASYPNAGSGGGLPTPVPQLPPGQVYA